MKKIGHGKTRKLQSRKSAIVIGIAAVAAMVIIIAVAINMIPEAVRKGESSSGNNIGSGATNEGGGSREYKIRSASGNDGNTQQPFDSMMSEMMEGNRMQMPVSKDVIMILESEYELPAGKQSEVSIKVLDKQTNEPMQGAQVIIGIEKGLPMTTMDMTGGGMFNALEKGNGAYAFVFTPESKGYYTIHAHVIPSGKQMHSMMENHADLIILSQ